MSDHDADASPGGDDDPFRGVHDPLGAPRTRVELRYASSREAPSPRAAVAAGGGAAGVFAVLAHSPAWFVFAAAAITAAVADWRRTRVIITTVVEIHDGGLRIDGVSCTWSDLRTVHLGFTPDGVGAPTITLGTSDGARRTLRGARRQLQTVGAAIEAAVTTSHTRDLERRLATQAQELAGYQVSAFGLHRAGTEVPWPALAPARRARGHLELGDPAAPIRLPIATVPNPWAIEALVASRGEPSR